MRRHDDEEDKERPREADIDHLRILSIFYYVFSGLMALCGTIPVIHLIVGLAIVVGGLGPQQQAKGQPPFPAWLFGGIFVVFASFAILFGWTLSICCMVVARSLKRRRRYLFCLITAGVCCLQQPFGLALGIFTIIVLTRPSVKAMFRKPPAEPPPLSLDPHDTYQSGSP